MRNVTALLFFLTICTLAACRKEPIPVPVPCADVVTDKRPLLPAWTWPEGDLSSIRPAVFDQQVVFSRHVGFDITDLLGFDGGSGQLLWQSTVPTGYLNYKNYRQVGSRLYFIDASRTELLCFDVATQQLRRIWTLPERDFLALQFAIQEGFAVCPAVNYFASVDSVELFAYVINLQSGQSRELLRFRKHIGNLQHKELLNPQITVTSAGDTLFCYVRAEDDRTAGYITRFVSVNMTTEVSTESEPIPGYYTTLPDNMVVEGNRAWLLTRSKLQCLDATTGAIIWQVDGYFERYSLLMRAGKVFALGYTREAFDAATGAKLWRLYGHSYYGEDLTTSFVRDGQLWLNQESNLRRFDLETGCLTRDHALPSQVGELVYSMSLAPDGKRIYFVSHKGFDESIFLAAPLPD